MDKRDEARALANPLPASPEIVEQGKAIYEGKKTRVNCHGLKGGDGPGSMNLNPHLETFGITGCGGIVPKGNGSGSLNTGRQEPG